MQRPHIRRIVYPGLVAIVLLAVWQGLVSGLELPPYLVPSPALMLKTLVTDWLVLCSALVVTVKITLFAFAVATVAGVLISFLFVQNKLAFMGAGMWQVNGLKLAKFKAEDYDVINFPKVKTNQTD